MQKILLVDDDPDMLALVERLLKQHGFSVRSLSEGKNVIYQIDVYHPHLLILDINLGDTDGREICQAIRMQQSYNDIPILLYSAESWPDLRIADCKADAFIQKPFSNSLLLQKIEKLIAA